MKSAGNIWRWFDNDKGSFRFNFPICCELGLKEPLFLPPSIPSRLDGGGIVGFVLRIVEGFDNYTLNSASVKKS
jgi:hypothetical protein